MNYKKWEARAKAAKTGGDPRYSPVWLAKLAEEMGEVGKAINEEGPEQLLLELEHVEFIATQYRKAIRNYFRYNQED
jgi:NTP pyrophosphatase (non-canonical NTP hydrolase)